MTHGKTEKKRLLTDDIKRCYRKKTELENEIGELERKKELASRQKEKNSGFLQTIERRSADVDQRLIQTQVNLNSWTARG